MGNPLRTVYASLSKTAAKLNKMNGSDIFGHGYSIQHHLASPCASHCASSGSRWHQHLPWRQLWPFWISRLVWERRQWSGLQTTCWSSWRQNRVGSLPPGTSQLLPWWLTALVSIPGGKCIAVGKASPPMKGQKKGMNGQFREITTPYKSPFFINTLLLVLFLN